MSSHVFRYPLIAVALLVAVAVTGCGSAAPQAAQQPAAVAQPTQAPTAIPPSATPVPPSPTPVPPSPTPVPPTPTAVPPTATSQASTAAKTGGAMPDAKADPMAALLYASSGAAFKTASFTYDMKMTMAPADDASATALGPAAAMLSQTAINGTGKGAMKIVDAATGKADMRMDMNIGMMGQQVAMQMITIGSDVWVRQGASGAWTKTTADKANTGGMDPKGMLETFQAATKVQYLDGNPLNGEAAHHLQVTIDPKKMDMAGFLKGVESGNSAMTAEERKALLDQMTMSIEVWLSAKDLAMRQERMVMGVIIPMNQPGMNAKLKATIDMTMKLDNINQPVTIEAPAG